MRLPNKAMQPPAVSSVPLARFARSARHITGVRRQNMLNATDHERQAIVDYLASQAPDERVELMQKLYSERLHGLTYDIWDVHTDKDRWWVITEPTYLYSQSQFPNMDLALTFHVGLCLRIPRSERQDVTDLPVEPLLGCWRAFQQAHDAIGSAQEVEDYQALGVRCRECLLSLVHSVQQAIAPPASAAPPKQSDFVGWAEAIADTALPGPSQKARRQLLKASANATWQFVNWLTHSRSAHFHDAEAALAADGTDSEPLHNGYYSSHTRRARLLPVLWFSAPGAGARHARQRAR